MTRQLGGTGGSCGVVPSSTRKGQGARKASSETGKGLQDIRAKYKDKRLLEKPKEGANSPISIEERLQG